MIPGRVPAQTSVPSHAPRFVHYSAHRRFKGGNTDLGRVQKDFDPRGLDASSLSRRESGRPGEGGGIDSRVGRCGQGPGVGGTSVAAGKGRRSEGR